MKYISILLILSGCATTAPQIQYQNIVIEPPSSLYECPLPPMKPNPETLTDKMVADYIKTVYKNNKTCYISIQKIKQFVEEAKRLAK